MEQLISNPKSRNKTLGVEKSIKIDSAIKTELDTLGIEVNSTLQKVIKSVSSKATLRAIDILKEALSKAEVPNMAGFLVAAIKNSWVPNQKWEEKLENTVFREWYLLAKSLSLIIASTKIDEVLHVLTTEEEWIPFSQMLEKYPIDKLKNSHNPRD